MCIWQEETASRSRVSAGQIVFLVNAVGMCVSLFNKTSFYFLVNLNYLL